jgi:tetratricopeptide (TPR) repeat protein
MTVDDARIAVAEGRWLDALNELDDLADWANSEAALELRVQAAYGAGQLEASIEASLRLHDLLVARGDDAAAGMSAAMIAMYLMMDTGMMAPVRGWLRRADRLIDAHPAAPAHAVVAMVRGYERFMSGDLAACETHAARAIELGERLGVNPAVVIGRFASARVRILTDRVEEGLEQLDELATLLASGGADPLTTGMMYCELICAAQGLALHDRAAEWTAMMDRWRGGTAFGGINGRCRVHRAELLRMSGPCDLAEGEALGACDDLRPWMRREFGWPLVELGNIRLRKGDLQGAEEAFLAAHRHAWSPYPGLALLRLQQGDASTAASLIADAIAHPIGAPSKERPPVGDLRLAPLYEAEVEIATARNDLDTARLAATRLREITDRFPSRWLTAGACLADARVALMAGKFEEAIIEATQAVVAWVDIGAPFETAMARLTLGEAAKQAGNLHVAQMEWRAARDSLLTYGATQWTARADALLENHIPLSSLPVGAPATGEFRLLADLRVVTFGGPTATVKDLIGLRYLERLLVNPGREFHVLDLVAVERGTLPTGVIAEGVSNGNDDALPILDEQARAAYRARLAEVDDDINEATLHNDIARIEKAQLDRDYLLAELSHAVGLGGRLRSSGSSVERARTSVTRSIRYALAQLERHHPIAANHLRRTVRTGMYCAYETDPSSRVTWET